MRRLAAVLVAVLSVALAAAGQESEGDRLYAARAEGHSGARANPANITAAIAAYQRAIAAEPQNLALRAKLLAAIRFKGAHVAQTAEQKKEVYGQGKAISEQAMSAVAKRIGVASLSKGSEKEVAAAAARVPGAASVFYWDSVIWGEWALAYGKMAALRQGAADRIKRNATIAMLADPRLEGGGPARVLGRLHNQTPRVPLVTGWASDKTAVKHLRDAMKIDPAAKITKVFLAEALVAADAGSKPEAVRLLRQVIDTPNPPDYLLESLQAQEDARALLRQWVGK